MTWKGGGGLAVCQVGEGYMTAKLLRTLEGERNKLWAEARRKGLAAGTPERDRIAEMDDRIRALKAELRG